jgi:hypothetical protein
MNHQRFFAWTALLLITAGYHRSCETKAAPCVHASLRDWLSPRALSDLIVSAGPLLLWLPLSLHVLSQQAPKLRAYLLLAAVSYLTFVWPVRLLRRATKAWAVEPPFDPSGHVFLYGTQLVPLWFVHISPSEDGALAALPHARLGLLIARCLEPVLFYWSAATGSFYHTFLEIAAAWALCTFLYMLCARVHQNEPSLMRTLPSLLPAAALAWATFGLFLLNFVPWSTKTFVNLLYDACVVAFAWRLSVVPQPSALVKAAL